MNGARLLHIEKSGPAFMPMTVVESLGASLVAQTETAIGQVFNAIQRKCLLDLMPAWDRLLVISGAARQEQRRLCLRRDWFWEEARDAVTMALCYSQTDSRAVKWAVADMLIRAEAQEAARRAEDTLARWGNSPDGLETADMLRVNIAAYKAFSEARS